MAELICECGISQSQHTYNEGHSFTPRQEVELTPEQIEDKKINDLCDAIVLEYIKNEVTARGKTLKSEEQSTIWLRTKRRIIAERAQFRQTLAEAENEAKTLHWSQYIPFRSEPIRGMQFKFVILFGNFALLKDGGWAYRPTVEQTMRNLRRWRGKKEVERFAHKKRIELKSITEEKEGQKIERDSPAMAELRKDLLEQIEEMRKEM